MKRKNLILLAVGILFVGIASSAGATLISLTPTDMTGLRKLGNGSSVSVLGYDSVKSGTEDRTIAHYGIGGTLDTFLTATLNIPIFDLDWGGTPGTFEVYAFNGDGKVSTDEWSSGSLMHTFTNIDDKSPTLSLDLTSYVYDSMTAGYDFLSFNFRGGAGTDRYWLSDACGLSNPTLSIEYSPSSNDSGSASNPVPEPATMLLLGVGLVTLGGFRIRNRKK